MDAACFILYYVYFVYHLTPNWSFVKGWVGKSNPININCKSADGEGPFNLSIAERPCVCRQETARRKVNRRSVYQWCWDGITEKCGAVWMLWRCTVGAAHLSSSFVKTIQTTDSGCFLLHRVLDAVFVICLIKCKTLWILSLCCCLRDVHIWTWEMEHWRQGVIASELLPPPPKANCKFWIILIPH